jgi:DNA-binding NarL/FixJ family response regulator
MRNTLHRPSEPITIAIADYNSIFMEGLYSIFKTEPDMKIVGQAKDGKRLLSVVEKFQPEVVLTEIKLPIMNGIEATNELKKKFPQLQVVAVTIHEEDHYIIDMLEAGANGYLIKGVSSHEVLDAVGTVHTGNPYYCTRTSNKLVNLMVKSKFNPYKPEKKAVFNEKELTVIRMICEEYSSKEIAQNIFTTVKYVNRLRERIGEKIGAKNIAGIVVYAVKNRIYTID